MRDSSYTCERNRQHLKDVQDKEQQKPRTLNDIHKTGTQIIYLTMY